MPLISGEYQVTLPIQALANAGFTPGDEVTIEAHGPDSIVLRRVRQDIDVAFGGLEGWYDPGYLAQIRSAGRLIVHAEEPVHAQEPFHAQEPVHAEEPFHAQEPLPA